MLRLLSQLIWLSPLLLGLLACRRESSETRVPVNNSRHTLSYKWFKDQTVHFRFDLSQEIDITAGSETAQNYTRIVQNYQLTPNADSGEGEFTIVMTFGHIEVSMKDAESEGSFDSAAPKRPQAGIARVLEQSLGKIANQEITLQITRGNRVGKITNLDRVLESMTRNIPATLRDMIHTIYGEDRIRQLVYLTPLPSGTLVNGYAWPIQETRPFSLLGQTELDGTAKLLSQETRNETRLYQIAISGNARKSATKHDSKPQPYILQNGTFEGRAWFDPELGQYADSVLTYKLDVSSTPALVKNNEAPLAIKVTQKYATKLLNPSD